MSSWNSPKNVGWIKFNGERKRSDIGITYSFIPPKLVLVYVYIRLAKKPVSLDRVQVLDLT